MILGLTGGIGSGKSVVGDIFATLGCLVFNSDQVAKEIYYAPPVRKQVIDLLGPGSYSSETAIDKTFISKAIFNDRRLLLALNAIIHPAVGAAFKIFVNDHPSKIIVKETALLFEAKLEHQVEKIVLVVADEELRINRVMKRDQLSREIVLKKIKSQIPQDTKIKLADFVIHNNGSQFLVPQVQAILNQVSHA